jgi:hypothetical protein
MSEFENTQTPPPQVTEEQARNWVAHVDEQDVLDQRFFFDRGQGLETVRLQDAVFKRHREEGTNEPVVSLKKVDGSSEEMPAGRFLELTGLVPSFEQFLGEKAVKEQQKQAEEDLQRHTQADRIKQGHERRLREYYEKRSAQLFTPLIRPTNELEHPGYDHLFNQLGQDKYEAYSGAEKEARKEQERYDSFVTPQSRQHAEEELEEAMQRDSTLSDIITGWSKNAGITKRDVIIDAIRTDADLRLSIGKHFLEKVDDICRIRSDRMPECILRNGGKDPDHSLIKTGHGMTSREWVALLCVAKLDGSFSKTQEDPYVSFNDRGVATVGQHRFAADLVLRTRIE